jgi:hypothetical protein
VTVGGLGDAIGIDELQCGRLAEQKIELMSISEEKVGWLKIFPPEKPLLT